MAAVWSPAESDLGTVLENQNFSHLISCVDDETGIPYTIVIVKQQVNPSTISTDNETISGYYYDAFDNSILYLNTNDIFVTVKKFEEIQPNAREMISYWPDMRRTIVYGYTAYALDDGNAVSSKEYTKTVQNDWTNGKNSLQNKVGELNARSN